MKSKRCEWFCHDRFGMFIHWGLYSIIGEGEWHMSTAQIPAEEYEKYAEEFNPVDFDAEAWAKTAVEAGMKYIVLTTKHHDGFCLFDSQYTEYKSTNTKANKDFVKEFVEAARKYGLKVGLYYSLVDWHHKDYPKYEDMFHPSRGEERYKEEQIDWENYLRYMHNQVEELCTNYGKIDILWFDFSYGDMKGEVWKSKELMKMVRRLQPDVIIDNRLEGGGSTNGSILQAEPSPICGDFASPEHCMPSEAVRNEKGKLIPWELCTTINNSWGYVSADRDYKTSGFLIRKLVECVAKSGNMILNVSPDGRGRIPDEQIKILREIGAWMKDNGESIYGCKGVSLPRLDWGWYTRNENTLYAHITEVPIGPIPLVHLKKEQIEKVRYLATESVVKDASMALGARRNTDIQYLTFGKHPDYTYPAPDPVDTVLKITFNK